MESQNAICPRCQEQSKAVCDKGAYILQVCRDCQLVQAPGLAPWQPFDSLDEFVQKLQCYKPPAIPET